MGPIAAVERGGAINNALPTRLFRRPLHSEFFLLFWSNWRRRSVAPPLTGSASGQALEMALGRLSVLVDLTLGKLR